MKKPLPVEYLQHLFKEDKFDELVSAAGQLITEKPDHVRAMYWRACALMRLDRMNEALNDLDRAIDMYDEYADAFSQRGVLYFHKGELQLALEDMNLAVELEPENPYRYSSRAYIKASLDQVESAIEDYEKAIELDPEDAVAHNNLGLLQEQLGYKSQAQSNMDSADRLMVNKEGELMDPAESQPIQTETGNVEEDRTYLQVLKNIFTTRKGFAAYLTYVKNTLFKR